MLYPSIHLNKSNKRSPDMLLIPEQLVYPYAIMDVEQSMLLFYVERHDVQADMLSYIQLPVKFIFLIKCNKIPVIDHR